MEVNKSFANNEVFVIVMALFVACYASYLGSGQKLPKYIADLFNNAFFRFIMLSLLLIYDFNTAPHVAFAVVLVFMITFYTIRAQEVHDNMKYLEKFTGNLDKNKKHHL